MGEAPGPVTLSSAHYRLYFDVFGGTTVDIFQTLDVVLVEGAEAFRGDLPAAAVHYLDGGHFVLEEHAARVAELILRHFTRERAAG